MPENELDIGKGGKDSLEILEVERWGEDYTLRVRAYKKAADERLAEMRAQGLIGVGRHALPEEEVQSLMQMFGLSQSLVNGESQENES